MDLGKLNTKLNERFLNTLSIFIYNFEYYEEIYQSDENTQTIEALYNKLSNTKNDKDFIGLWLMYFLVPEKDEKVSDEKIYKILDYNRIKNLVPYIAEEMEAAGLSLEDVEIAEYLPLIRASIDVNPILSLEEIRDCFSMGPFENCVLNALKTYYKKDGFPVSLYEKLTIIELLDAFDVYDNGNLQDYLDELEAHAKIGKINATAEATAEAAPNRLPVRIQLFPLDKIWSVMQLPGIILSPEERAENGKPFGIPVSRENGPENRVIFTLEDDANIKISDHFTAFEMACLSAVFSEINAGNTVFSDEDLARGVLGLPAKSTVTESTKDKIKQSMAKFTRTNAEIDFSEGLKNRDIKDNEGNIVESFIREGRILDHEIVKLKTNRGTTKSYYWLRTTPAIYEYLSLTKRMASVPRWVLDIRVLNPDGSIGTRAGLKADRGLPILYALINRLSIMKRETKKALDTYRKQFNSNGEPKKSAANIKTPIELWENARTVNAPYRIKTRSIADAAGIEITGAPGTQRKKEKDIRVICEEIFKYWVATGYIDGYREAKKGQSIIGYDIIFNGINDK